MNLNELLNEIKNSDPSATETEQAAARVKSRLFPAHAGASAHHTAIRGCADFAALMPAHLAGTLDANRKLLLEVHTRECVGCRKALEGIRSGARQIVEFPKPRPSRAPKYALAATALLAATAATYFGLHRPAAAPGGSRASVETIEGALYKVEGSALTPLAPGADFGEDDLLETGKNSRATLRLNDGSRIELNQRARVSVTRSLAGSTIHLALGSIIVQAAKQRSGLLQVATADCNVSVKGTIFSVNAGIKGSRVAVAEGTVWVDHADKHDVLHKGDETSTAADMATVPIRDEFAWSQNSARYVGLLAEFDEIKHAIAAIPAAELRHESRLMAWLPADTAVVAAIPNVGDTLGEADQIFHARLDQNAALNAWWNHLPASNRDSFETTLRQLVTASAYLGNEIVIAATKNPIILAQIVKPGLDAFLKSQLPAQVYDRHMRFDQNIFVAASDPADLPRITPSGDFLRTALYGRIAPLYGQGAGWLAAADLARLGPLTTVADARFIVAQSRTVAGTTENRASVTFTKERQGVASWLAAPGPMGSLDFISPDATLTASVLLRNPTLIADDIARMMKIDPDSELKRDMAGAFGGEISVALDGPIFPVPSWKIAAEVYYPDRLQSTIAKYVALNPDLHLTQTDAFYTLKSDKVPWEADWTFIDGYWLAAASHELLVRSIQNRQTGYTMAKSGAFRSKLPSETGTNLSAVLSLNSTVVGIWAGPDSIEAATKGNLLGLNLEQLLSMSPGSMLGMVGKAVPPALVKQ